MDNGNKIALQKYIINFEIIFLVSVKRANSSFLK